MKEYIERETALKVVCEKVYFNNILPGIKAIPTADVAEVRHGHWIKITKVHPDLLNDSTYNYRCSNCGYMDTHGANVEVPYCWHCGAKMDEVGNGRV